MAKRRVSKKLQEYRKARKAYMERRRYWKKKGVDVGEAIARVEKPTKADIRELQQSLTKTSEKVVAFKEAIKMETPFGVGLVPNDLRLFLYDHLMSSIDEYEAGAMESVRGEYGKDWAEYKANLVREAVTEIVKRDFNYKYSESGIVDKIDKSIELFIYDSGNRKNDSYKAHLQAITAMLQNFVGGDNDKQVPVPMTYDGEEFFDPNTGEILT